MFRIDDVSAAATLPTPEAAGTEGFWTEGNPATGEPATLERASWFNMIQEELRAITVAGGLTPSKTTYNQIIQAIKRLFGGNVRTITAAGTTVLTADDAGLVIVDATANNVAITMPAVNAVTNAPLFFEFVRIDASANTATISCAGSDTLVGGATSFTLIVQNDYRSLVGNTASSWVTTSAAANLNTTDYKASVRATTVGANITLAGSAPNTLDGVTLVANDRILVKDQTTASQNGIYYVATLGTGANGTWTRATDADGAGELTSGAIVAVEEGSTNADSQWMQTTDGTITIGTTALVFARKDSDVRTSSFTGSNQSLAASGYQKLPGGLIIQWATGVGNATANTASAVTFPIAFPNNCLSIATNVANNNASAITAAAYGKTTSGFVSYCSIAALNFNYIAIGN